MIDLAECFGMGCYMTAESELQAPAGGDESPGKVDQLLDDRFYPPALGLMADDPFCVDQRNLADEAQKCVSPLR